ncbi:muscle M-line assembly protein unc-89-like isoform X2 [Dendroctonus ponderosae]|uniref:muscle M-line assembly protein unc-89 isoform X2 n=1 Tax=Dendroctonus ponderosae TaxID=77166 RepID=UPI0020350A9A|nr:muscle M-line assembly protein unc-89 isoform X2 [Dendroctonus ponderosae]XP_048521359.1 muscle M-line assembly protein unc-89-like isoform X2 [Dendroctonus ponderosae]
MGNAHIKPHPRVRNKKQVHWKAADRSGPPGKPELLPESEGTPDLVSLRWTRPVNDGGSPITGYLVEHRRVGSPHWVRATPLPVPFPEITLSGLEPGWRYQFRVSSENAVGYSNPSEVSEPITVTLHRSAVTAPKFTQEVSETVALENEKCEFVVHFLGQPAPKVCWFKDGFEIFSSRRIRVLTEHDRSVLTIHQTSLSDEGEIKCTATNRAGHVSSKSRLTVEAPPSIRLPRNYEEGLLFELGEIIRLKVTVVGRPNPLVFWSHNGESLQNNDRYEIDYTDKSLSLKIADAQRSDRGEYQVKAVNKLGEETASFLVTVTDKPSPPGKARVVMTLGRSVTLSWTSPQDDGGCKIGNYIVEYYRLGWNVWLKAATSRQLTTRLGDLIEGSEYKFRIKAESPYGVSDPSEESEVVFIPDLKRGLTHPPPHGRNQPQDFFEELTSPTAKRRNKPRSLSSTRVEVASHANNSIPQSPPTRPKRTKSKSQHQTPEASPMLPRKDVSAQFNKNIFDRSSLARDLAYGSPDLRMPKNMRRDSLTSNMEKIWNKIEKPEPKVDHVVYKVKIESPAEALTPVVVEPKKNTSPERRKKLIREHSATVSGSSEFMLVLYSDENNQDQSNVFNFDDSPVAPPLSLSAPELSTMEPLIFLPLKNSASSTELLHERTMMRFFEAAEAEERELERIRAQNSERRPSYEIPKIRINSQDSDDIVGLDRRHSLRRKMSAGTVRQQQKWAHKRHSLKSTSEVETLAGNNLKRALPSLNMKRELMFSEPSTSEELTDQEFERARARKKTYSQASFERKPVTITEEERWMDEYEESLSESETDSESEVERFKSEVNKTRHVQIDQASIEEDTYRPPGGLGALRIRQNILEEPFEILNKKKELPDPNFVPKPILKKTDSPLVSPNVSPAVSPPSSPTKAPRALSPRPDIILQRNRSKSLAVPVLPPLISSSGDESDDQLKQVRKRSFSLTTAQSLLPKKEPKISKKTKSNSTLPSVSAVAQISGMTAASIVIPNNLLSRKKADEEAKAVADHYDHIVRSIGQRRRSNPFLDREELKRAADSGETPQEEENSSKEQTPSKENLSQDSGYQSVSGYRRSSFTDHYDSVPIFRSPMRRPSEESNENFKKLESVGQSSLPPAKPPVATQSSQPRRLSDVGQVLKEKPKTISTSSPRRDSGVGIQLGNFASSPQRANQGTSTQTQSTRQSSPNPKSRRSVTRSKSPSKRGTSITRNAALSPARTENWNNRSLRDDPQYRPRKTSPSPVRKGKSSPSKNLEVRRRPMLKEIMTQTSGFLDSFQSYTGPGPSTDPEKHNELRAQAEVKVRSAVDWLTDLAMFAVACWLYLFHNELLAIPVLLVMVYRQLKEEIEKRIPQWVLKKMQKKKTE